MDAFAFAEAAKTPEPQPVYVLVGDERFLKQAALARIQSIVLGKDADDFGRSTHEGDTADFASIMDELQTLPFLASRRLVVVQDADKFVTEHRKRLEKYVANPSSSGVLVLDVKTWPATTLLAKAVPDAGTIKCESLKAQSLPGWCKTWATKQHGKQLTSESASMLVELVGTEMGVLAQEIAKLAAYVGDRERIMPDEVDKMVGHSRVETAWKMLDAVAEGRSADAFAILDHLFQQGEEPIGVLGAMSWQLRKLAQVARLQQQGVPISTAMSRAGIPPFNHRRVEPQIRQLGPRAMQIYDWLVEADLNMKSTDALPRRLLLERLLVRLGPRID